jgi:predicted DNA-binding protein
MKMTDKRRFNSRPCLYEGGPMVQRKVRMPLSQDKALKKLSKRTGRLVSELVRDGIELKIQSMKK